MQINRHNVGANVASLGTITNEERFEDMANHFHHFILNNKSEEVNFVETSNNGAPTKRFNIHTDITLPVSFNIEGESEEDARDNLEAILQMAIDHIHVMFEMAGGQTVIPRVSDNLCEMGESNVEEAYEDE
ncbi:hypothetical protein [Bacillus halotolerans]|uniref:hypothetical protein n=1 Tax=Bacillus halotolerans TaxID=260554 RepID=UPI0020C2B9E6|nr:hypothetical protein [Bacillus halotolerans]UTL77901.1 hypothetical protein NLW79_06600 [Bacillus halotolerans]WJE44348.1 hypothetical protein QRD86_07225 [Bacillus halotolerans]WPC81899.1 hypothetical protein RA179_06615 [Bacillus halotolerans]